MMMSRNLLVGLVIVGGGLSMGCSEAVPPAAKGATFVNFSSATAVPGGSCNVGQPHNGKIGVVDLSDVRDFATDTLGGAKVFCKVSSNGGGFTAQGNMTVTTSTKNTHLDFNIAEISSANDASNPAQGSLSYSDVETVNSYTSTSEYPCNFWIGGNGQGVIEGELWVEFQCPALQNVSISSSCSISAGSAIAMADCEI